MNILVSGSLVFDRIMDFPGKFSDHILPDKIHNINLSFVINGLKENFGGTAGNIAYNLALLGENPYLLACVGADFAPYEKWLKKNKLNISEIKNLKTCLTSSAYIITDKADNQIAGFNPGAMNFPREAFNKKLFKNSLAIVSPGNIGDMENYSSIYKKNKVRYIFDPGQALTALSAEVLKKSIDGAEILIGNDYEIELIKKKTKWTEKQIIDKVKVLIITKGEKGSEIYEGKNKYIITAAKPKVIIDPTGAGDAYRAGLIKGMLSGWDWEKTGQFAGVVASFAIEKHGGQEHKFSRKDLERRYGESFGEKIRIL